LIYEVTLHWAHWMDDPRQMAEQPRSTQPGRPSVGGSVSTSDSWGIDRHTALCTSTVCPRSSSVNWCLAQC